MKDQSTKRKPVKKTSSAAKQSYNYNRITHLYLNDKYLRKIPKLSDCQYLSVIYLHNNEIHTIENLDTAYNLTSLYLQHNTILKIENLASLKRLKKLYLGHNNISVVEGLENLNSLEELHLEKQFLMEGNCLCFDPRSIARISNTLQVLDISHNKISSLSSLMPLKFLTYINASHNELDDLEELCDIVKGWCHLREASFVGNPLAQTRPYRESVIANVYCLEVLDNKTVTESTRILFKNLYKEKKENGLKKIVNFAESFHDLPKNYPTSIQKAVSVSMLRSRADLTNNSEVAIFDERNAVYIPWKTLPKPRPISRVPAFGKFQKKIKEKRTSNILKNQFAQLKL